MTDNGKQVFLTIYETLRYQQETLHETFCAANALVKTVCEISPAIAKKYERHHLKIVSETLVKSSQALADIDAMIEKVKEM